MIFTVNILEAAEQELAELDTDSRANLSRQLLLLKDSANHKPPLTKPVTKKLFEVRYVGKPNNVRAMFCFRAGAQIYVLHVFVKKQNSVPEKNLKIAMTRARGIE